MIIEEVLNNQQINIVEKLACEIWNQHFIPIIGKSQVDYMLDKFQSKKALSEQIKQGFSYYLLKNNNNYIGYLSILPKEKEMFISKLYLKFSERGNGFGKKSIQFVGKLAKKKGLNRITLTVNKYNLNSIKAYEKMGFKIIGTIVQNIGNGFLMDDFKMEKTIKYNRQNDGRQNHF